LVHPKIMANAIRRLLQKLKRFRMKLSNSLDFSKKKKNEPKRSLEVKGIFYLLIILRNLALAVRESVHSCDEGMYCRLVYGSAKKKTQRLGKRDSADWKEQFFLSSYLQGDLLIEVWRRKKNEPLKKFLGRIRLTQKQLDEAPNGIIKAWYPLQGRGKKRDVLAGKLFVNLVLPHNVQITQPTQFQEPLFAPKVETKPLLKPKSQPDAHGVVDRLHELKPDVPKATNRETELNEFQLRTGSIERIVRNVDLQIRLLETKLMLLQKRGGNLFLAQEVESLAREIEDVLAVATKRLKEVGNELNAT